MPGSFHVNVAVDWPVHSHGFNHVRNPVMPAKIANNWAEQVVYTEEVHEVKAGEMGPAESYHTRVYRKNAITRHGRQIDCLDAVLCGFNAHRSFSIQSRTNRPFG